MIDPRYLDGRDCAVCDNPLGEHVMSFLVTGYIRDDRTLRCPRLGREVKWSEAMPTEVT